MPFAALGLSPAMLNAMAEQGWTTPTPIQDGVIPRALEGRDVLACAPTGSGKTAAYVLPLLQQWQGSEHSSPRRLRALVLVPTRELADQIGQLLLGLSQNGAHTPKVAVVYGGVSINPQMMALRGGADIVVATPGRLLDLVEHNALKLGGVATLVLDEADRLLDMGFRDELDRIVALLPARRQNLLLSATLPPDVAALAGLMLHRPVRIDVPTEPTTRPDILQRAIEVDAAQRTQLLRHLIQTAHTDERVLVFVASKYATELVAHKLARAGIHAAPFHGELSQGTRREVLHALKTSALQVVVATDVAARGIDIVQLPVVVNFDLPRSAATYTHRIGRTGRAGEPGLAYSFISPDTEAHFRLIEKRQGLRVPREQIAGFEPTTTATVNPLDPSGNGGVKGKRQSKKDKLRQQAIKPDA